MGDTMSRLANERGERLDCECVIVGGVEPGYPSDTDRDAGDPQWEGSSDQGDRRRVETPVADIVRLDTRAQLELK